MDTLVLILILTIALIFVLSIVLLIVFIKRMRAKSTRVYFIYDDNNIKTKRYKNIQEKFDFEGKTYLYDSKFALKKMFSQHIFYYVKNPNPIDFTTGKNREVSISSQNLNKLLKDDLIGKLFGTQDVLEKAQSVLILVGVLIGIVVLFLMIKINSGGVNLADNPQNREILKSVIQEVIAGV